MRILIIGFIVSLVLSTTAEAGLRRRCCRLRRCHKTVYYHHTGPVQKGPVQKSGPVQKDGAVQKGDSPIQKAAQWRANTLAASGYGYHFSLPCYGAGGEGWGMGGSPQAALSNCCVTSSGVIAAQATAQSSNGTWFAIRLYW